MGVEDRHLIWANHLDDDRWDTYILLTDRTDRQSLPSPPVREMGVRWWPTVTDIPVAPQSVIVTPERLVDIDTAADYQQIARRLNIWFQLRANKTVGTGHLRRVLTLAEGLQHHNIEISYTEDSDHALVDPIYTDRGWHGADPPGQVPDVMVYDKLDTTRADYQSGIPTVTIEDRKGGRATAVINAMYRDRSNLGFDFATHYGPRYAVLRPEFTTGRYRVKQDPDRGVLILFGGTDPANLTGLAEHAVLASGANMVKIRPGDDISVAAEMHDADLLITSGGRTVFEAAAVGIPTIVMCQNVRETTHTHLGVGNINLGLGRMVEPDRLRYVVEQTLGDYELRRDMSVEASRSIDGQGASRVRRIIEHVGLYGEAP